ncbi:cupin domain-containing protein [Hymenobacter cavernae]|uniref:Cupin n=1 Tax=Hymenobacter cavernae TaxID=2044852 RepID=A0ABQ1UMI2_9BACT|nr:cupin domain-containing protein [Hymenobacter cavernae]GGF22548.1 cupin [Hymenobacter cavernae]
MSTPTNTPQTSAGTKGGQAEYFTDTAWVTMLAGVNLTDCTIGDVTFEPGARNNWHLHPAGQILMVTNRVGYYQEKGQPIRLLRKGEVVKAQPGVEHWHGASPKQALTHIALNINTEKGIVNWERPITNQEYNSYK